MAVFYAAASLSGAFSGLLAYVSTAVWTASSPYQQLIENVQGIEQMGELWKDITYL